jgi:ArsR family transcriptional regulator, virulence genes transcriptional regulator
MAISKQKQQLFKMQADICKTMSDPKRLMIMHELRNGELSVGQLSTQLELPQANVSQHLAIMRKRGIVSTRREGTTVFYSLASCKIGEACDMVRDVLNEQLSSTRELAALIDKS